MTPSVSPTMTKESARALSRRRLMTTGIASAAAAGVSPGTPTEASEAPSRRDNGVSRRLPREVTIATVSQDRLKAASPEDMVRRMLQRCESAAATKPDLVCLPEVFPFAELDSGRPPVEDVAGTPLTKTTRPIAEFARRHGCYVICPTYTRHDGRLYNSSILLDRQGNVAGQYHKIRLTPGEVEKGLTPGPDQPPVFDTDFGKLGMQICFDIEWPDGWRKLRDAGAEIVVWPSAFAGGRMVETHAWQNRYVVVSSVRKDTGRICDVDGTTIASTSRWNQWATATVNLEKAFLHTWPFVNRFDELYAKYGPKIRITTHPEEEWSIIESRAADVKVADVLAEFDLQAIDDYLTYAEKLQQKAKA